MTIDLHADCERRLAEARREAEALRARLASALEDAAKICETMPIQIYQDDGIGPAARSCKPATFEDAAEMIRALARPDREDAE